MSLATATLGHHTHQQKHGAPKTTKTGVVITGPSGVGKTSLVSAFRALDPTTPLLLSDTTRPPRVGDLPGEYQYHCRNGGDNWFDLQRIGKTFLWHVNPFGSHMYGTRKSSLRKVLDSKKLWLSHLVPEKVEELWTHTQAFVPIYLDAAPEEIETQLLARGDQVDEDEITRRLTECAEWKERAERSEIPYHFIRGAGGRAPILIAIEIIEILRTHVPEELLAPYLILDPSEDD